MILVEKDRIMREGLYKVQFQTQLGAGAGVAVARDGKMWGGDSGIFYTGTYKDEGGTITASVAIDRHTKHPGIASVFGVDRANITLTGKDTGSTITMTGKAAQAPGVSFQAILTHLAD
jgi:hypothetical protein